MAGLIRRSDIDEVRSRTNIADVIGEYVTLKPAGVGSLKGLCPFHEERSPSFNVRPQVGMFHCFGCGEGGNVFQFLMKIDHVSFQEAVERLAGRLGLELRYEDGGRQSEHGNRTRLLAANAAAAEFFVAQLAGPEGEPGRAFLGQRGFDAAAAARFGVGFAPRGGALTKHLRAVGFTDDEIVQSGAGGRGDRGEVYDRFRSRLIWPIRDTTGQTVGFGARRLLEEDQGPKYLNTPETPIYHKAQVLYGLDLAKRDIAKQRRVVVVEGYTDVMACHLAGVTTAVATCGTAFGVDHIRVVRRIMGDSDDVALTAAGEVIFTFDPDEAGQKAATRAFAEEQRFAAQTFVAVAPDGLDPCDLRIHHGDAAVRSLIETRTPMFEFMIRRTFAGFDLEAAEGRVAALRAAAPVVAGIRDEALTGEYARLLAKWLGVEPAAALAAVNAARSRGDRPRRADEPTSEIPTEAPAASLASLPGDPNTRLERDALMAILQLPGDVGPDLAARAAHAAFANAALAVVRDALAGTLATSAEDGWVETVAEEAPEAFRSLVRELAVAPIPGKPETIGSYARSVVVSLIDRDLLREKRDALGALQRLDRESEPERFQELQRRLVGIEGERRVLRGD